MPRAHGHEPLQITALTLPAPALFRSADLAVSMLLRRLYIAMPR